MLMIAATAQAQTLSMTWSGIIGATGATDCDDIASDRVGNIYLACHSLANDFPGVPPRSSDRRDFDGYLAKLNGLTGKLIYSVRLGGTDYDDAIRVRLDEKGNAYVTGFTKSRDFQTTLNGFQRIFGGGDTDAFLAKIDTQGNLVYCTFFGGTGDDLGDALVLDGKGKVYMGGVWNEDGFVAAFELAKRFDPKVIRFGGKSEEKLTGLAIDSGGHIWATGYTKSKDFPVRNGQGTRLKGDSDAFLVKMDANLNEIELATYFGGSKDDSGWGITADTRGNVYVAGITNSTDPPVAAGASDVLLPGRKRAFAAKFNGSGALQWSTYFGGSGEDEAGYDGANIIADKNGHIWMVGMTSSHDLALRGATQHQYGGGELDGFILGLNADDGRAIFTTYFGGEDRDLLEGITLDPKGNLWVCGVTWSKLIPGAPSGTIGGTAQPYLGRWSIRSR